MKSLKQKKRLKDNILSFYKKATQSEIEEGLNWYSEAKNFCIATKLEYETKYPSLTVKQIAQITSILSPQIDWQTNKKNVIEFLKYGYLAKIFATNKQKEKCALILQGFDILKIKAIKTFSFAENIYNHDSESVTIDRHAFKVANNEKSGGKININISDYRRIALCYNEVAKEIGIKGFELQAICWVAYKRIVGR